MPEEPHIPAASPTFPLDAVVVLAVLVGQGVGPWLRQHVLRGARDPVLALGVLGAEGARGGHALHLPTERALAGAHSLSHCAARHHRILLSATCMQTHTQIQVLVTTLYSSGLKYINDNTTRILTGRHQHWTHTELLLRTGKPLTVKMPACISLPLIQVIHQ